MSKEKKLKKLKGEYHEFFCYKDFIINTDGIAFIQKYYSFKELMIKIQLKSGKSLSIQIDQKDVTEFEENFFEIFKKYTKKI